jgi:hypothetical protein
MLTPSAMMRETASSCTEVPPGAAPVADETKNMQEGDRTSGRSGTIPVPWRGSKNCQVAVYLVSAAPRRHALITRSFTYRPWASAPPNTAKRRGCRRGPGSR